MKKDVLADSLGVSPLSVYAEEKTKSVVVRRDSDFSQGDDYADGIDDAERAIKEVLLKGEDILEEIIEVAKQSEKARDYEVANGIMKTIIDAQRDLVDLRRKKCEHLKTTSPSPDQMTNITNNNLVISTADLLKMIKGNN